MFYLSAINSIEIRDSQILFPRIFKRRVAACSKRQNLKSALWGFRVNVLSLCGMPILVLTSSGWGRGEGVPLYAMQLYVMLCVT
jgi:hypothetical protein